MEKHYYDAGKKIIQDAPQLYVDIDIEADGIAGYGSMLSIGAVTPFGETFYREIAPVTGQFIPRNKEFCETHNLERTRLAQDGIPPMQAIKEFNDWSLERQNNAQKSGLVFSAYNASFDFPFVDLYYKLAEIENPYSVAGYCIKSLCQALEIKKYDWGQTKKSQLTEAIVPKEEFTHNALEDALWQQKLHFALIGKLALCG